MKLKNVIILTIILGGSLAGGIYAYVNSLADWKEKVAESNVKLEAARDTIDQLQQIADTINARADSSIAAAEVRVDSLIRSSGFWRRESRRTTASLNVALETLEDSTAERVRSIVDNIERQHEQEVITLRLALAAKDTIIESWKAKYEIQGRLNRQLQVALAESETQIEFWQGEAKPSFLGKYADNWTVLVTGFVACIIVDRLLFDHGGSSVVVINDDDNNGREHH